MSALVIGGGPAGVFAALRLKQRGVSTRIVWATPGAAELGSGAFDWSEGDGRTRDQDLEHRDLLELWPGKSLLPGPEEARFLSEAGVSSGHYCGSPWLFHWERVRGSRVAVVDAPEFAFHAREFCRAASQDPWVREARIEMVPVAGVFAHLSSGVPSTRIKCATHLDQSPQDFLPTLADLARETGAKAWVFPSCLGLDCLPTSSSDLYFGELLSGLSGLEGERYTRIRERILQEQGIETIRGHCLSYLAGDGSTQVALEGGATLATDLLVLATGGFFSGGRNFSSEGRVEQRVASLSEHGSMQAGVTAEERVSLFHSRGGVPVDRIHERIVRVGELVRPSSFIDAARAGIQGANQLMI